MINSDLTRAILEKFPRARDDDNYLVIKQWAAEMKTKGTEPVTLLQIYNALSEGVVTQPETITRARRKLQEEDPELRGEKFFARHQKSMEFKTEVRGWKP